MLISNLLSYFQIETIVSVKCKQKFHSCFESKVAKNHISVNFLVIVVPTYTPPVTEVITEGIKGLLVSAVTCKERGIARMKLIISVGLTLLAIVPAALCLPSNSDAERPYAFANGYPGMQNQNTLEVQNYIEEPHGYADNQGKHTNC